MKPCSSRECENSSLRNSPQCMECIKKDRAIGRGLDALSEVDWDRIIAKAKESLLKKKKEKAEPKPGSFMEVGDSFRKITLHQSSWGKMPDWRNRVHEMDHRRFWIRHGTATPVEHPGFEWAMEYCSAGRDAKKRSK